MTRSLSAAAAVLLVGLALTPTARSTGPALTQQGAKLQGAEAIGKAEAGLSVALSADGNTALVGAPGDNGFKGAAFVFTRAGGTWSQQGPKLLGGGGEGNSRFGTSVALSADGNTALIGGIGDAGGDGAVWAFTRSGSTWSQQGTKLTAAGEAEGGELGTSASLSADGNTALVGSYRGTGSGASWVFVRSEGSWTQQAGPLIGGGELGKGVALSADGDTALIGAPLFASEKGSANVYTRSGASWGKQGSSFSVYCTASCGGSEGTGAVGAAELGSGVALSADGDTALIGGRTDASSEGAAWVFVRSGEAWSQQGTKLAVAERPDGELGESVALSADGNTALLGAFADRGKQGSAFVFARAAGAWSQREELTGSEGLGQSLFGASVALSAEATTALVGGPGDGAEVGAAWVFTSGAGTGAPGPIPGPGGGKGTGGSVPPLLSNVSQSSSVWREGRRRATLSRARRPVGTVISFTLNEPASVTLAFGRSTLGRIVAHRCVASTRSSSRHKRCARKLAEGSLTLAGRTGRNKLAFDGVVSPGKKLSLGRHTVTIVAKNAAGQRSSAHALTFTIVR
jgi:hypothetical protein